MAGEKEYMDVIYWGKKRDGSALAISIGFASVADNGDIYVTMKGVPLQPWDGSLTIQKKRERR